MYYTSDKKDARATMRVASTGKFVLVGCRTLREMSERSIDLFDNRHTLYLDSCI